MTESDTEDTAPEPPKFEVPESFLKRVREAEVDNEAFLESLMRVNDMVDFRNIKNFLSTSMNMYDQWQKQTIGHGDPSYHGHLSFNRTHRSELMKMYTLFRDLHKEWERYESKMGVDYTLPPDPFA